jgi:hypothetical protein
MSSSCLLATRLILWRKGEWFNCVCSKLCLGILVELKSTLPHMVFLEALSLCAVILPDISVDAISIDRSYW